MSSDSWTDGNVLLPIAYFNFLIIGVVKLLRITNLQGTRFIVITIVVITINTCSRKILITTIPRFLKQKSTNKKKNYIKADTKIGWDPYFFNFILAPSLWS